MITFATTRPSRRRWQCRWDDPARSPSPIGRWWPAPGHGAIPVPCRHYWATPSSAARRRLSRPPCSRLHSGAEDPAHSPPAMLSPTQQVSPAQPL